MPFRDEAIRTHDTDALLTSAGVPRRYRWLTNERGVSMRSRLDTTRGTIAFALVIKATPEGAVSNAKFLQSTVLLIVLFNCTALGVVFPWILQYIVSRRARAEQRGIAG